MQPAWKPNPSKSRQSQIMSTGLHISDISKADKGIACITQSGDRARYASKRVPPWWTLEKRTQRKTPVLCIFFYPSLSPLLKFLGKMGFIVPQHTVRTCPVHVHCTRYGKTERDKSLERCWGQPLTPSMAPQPQPWPCISCSSRCFWCGWVWAGIGSPALWVRTWDMYGLSVPLWHHVPCSLMELPGRVVFNLFPSSFP